MQLDAQTQKIVDAGRDALARLKKQETWQDWVATGRAIEAGRASMMRYLRTNAPVGRVWSAQFGEWLRCNGFDQIDKGVRSRLQSCIDNLPAVEEWRLSIGLTKALEFQHPNTVWRKFEAARKPKQAAEPKAEKVAQDNLSATIERLEAVADRVEHEQLMLDLDNPEEAARVFIDYYGDDAAKRFADFVSFLLLEKVAPDIARRVSGAEADTAAVQKVQEVQKVATESGVVEVAHKGRRYVVDRAAGVVKVVMNASPRRRETLRTVTDQQRIKRILKIANAQPALAV